MGNVVLGVPAGPVRPFASVGIGLIRRTVSFVPGTAESGVTDSRVAYSIGGGVIFFIGSRVGIDADLRYFRNFSTGNAVLDLPNEHFNYARGSVGIVFRF
jgi:opacity protein-like surface antigen